MKIKVDFFSLILS